RLGGHAEVYDGELAVMYFGACKVIMLAEEDNSIKHLHFFTDNTSVITTILDPRPRLGQLYAHQFHRRICKFLDTDPEHTVEIAWSPGHCDIEGNKRAEELAKEGVEMAMQAGDTRLHALRKSREKMQKVWVKEWKVTLKTGHYAMANRIPPS
ncbi:hypothetical protein B0H17DRAFT_849828, partial [Mycena rosella]